MQVWRFYANLQYWIFLLSSYVEKRRYYQMRRYGGKLYINQEIRLIWFDRIDLIIELAILEVAIIFLRKFNFMNLKRWKMCSVAGNRE